MDQFAFGSGFAERAWPPAREGHGYPWRLLREGALWPNLVSDNRAWGFLRLSADPVRGDDLRHTQLSVMPDTHAPCSVQPHSCSVPEETKGPVLLLKVSTTHLCRDSTGKGVQELFSLKEHLPLQWEEGFLKSHSPAWQGPPLPISCLVTRARTLWALASTRVAFPSPGTVGHGQW